MADIKISIDDLPPAITLYNADVFVIDQLGGDGYTKKITYQTLKAALGNDAFVYRAGDTMTGNLYLNTSSPISALQAASKGYVDAQTSLKVSKAGDVMTGPLTLNTNSPVASLHAASRGYVQNNFIPISGIGTGEQNTGMSGFLTLNNHPQSSYHASTKYFVENIVGLSAQSLLNRFNSLSGTNSRTVAKVWVNFNGTTSPPAINSSFNVSSVTKNSTGLYTITFATPMSGIDYCAISTAKQELYPTIGTFSTGENTRTTTSIQVTTGTYSTLYDSPVVNVIIFSN